MSQPVLLTDSTDPAIAGAAGLLESWTAVVRPERELAQSLDQVQNVRAIVVTTNNPNALREVFEQARARSIPVVVGCKDETTRRRAVELRADDWFRLPADSDEVAARVRSAIVRAAPSASSTSRCFTITSQACRHSRW